MESIITTNLKEITLSSQFLTVTTPKGDLEIDIKAMLKEPVNSDKAYFNATTVAKMYNIRLDQIFRTREWKDYVQEMEKQVNSKSHQLVGNRNEKKVNSKSHQLLSRDNHGIKMVKTVRGKHHSGTWLHSKMILVFLRKLDVKFAVTMDLFIQDLIIHSNELKIERNNTKVLFHPLTDSIRDIYIPNQISENAKKFAYSTLLTLANIKVLGCSGKKYATDNNIIIDKNKNIRDYLSLIQLDKIKEVEQDIHGMLKYGKITDYEDIKKELINESN